MIWLKKRPNFTSVNQSLDLEDTFDKGKDMGESAKLINILGKKSEKNRRRIIRWVQFGLNHGDLGLCARKRIDDIDKKLFAVMAFDGQIDRIFLRRFRIGIPLDFQKTVLDSIAIDIRTIPSMDFDTLSCRNEADNFISGNRSAAIGQGNHDGIAILEDDGIRCVLFDFAGIDLLCQLGVCHFSGIIDSARLDNLVRKNCLSIDHQEKVVDAVSLKSLKNLL